MAPVPAIDPRNPPSARLTGASLAPGAVTPSGGSGGYFAPRPYAGYIPRGITPPSALVASSGYGSWSPIRPSIGSPLNPLQRPGGAAMGFGDYLSPSMNPALMFNRISAAPTDTQSSRIVGSMLNDAIGGGTPSYNPVMSSDGGGGGNSYGGSTASGFGYGGGGGGGSPYATSMASPSVNIHPESYNAGFSAGYSNAYGGGGYTGGSFGDRGSGYGGDTGGGDTGGGGFGSFGDRGSGYGGYGYSGGYA
jgi:hypothetical protein